MPILRIHDGFGNKVIVTSFQVNDVKIIIPGAVVRRIMKRLRGLKQTVYYKGQAIQVCGPYDSEIHAYLPKEGEDHGQQG